LIDKSYQRRENRKEGYLSPINIEEHPNNSNQ